VNDILKAQANTMYEERSNIQDPPKLRLGLCEAQALATTLTRLLLAMKYKLFSYNVKRCELLGEYH